METKFTPGPWHWNDRTGEVISANGRGIVSMPTASFEPNAYLIAAAPELLAALECALLALEECANFTPTRTLPDSAAKDVRAAIAKAKGE